MLRRNILIFHNAALGDFVVTWPLAIACGRLLPQSRVIYVTAAGKGKLAEHVLGVESVEIESGFSSLWSSPDDVPAAAKKMLEGTAIVLSFVASEGDAWSQSVRAIAPHTAVSYLSTKPAAKFLGHVSQAIVSQLQPTQPAIATAMGLMVDSLTRRGFASRPVRHDGVLIHPGSGAERKNWPRDRFVELARRLKTAGCAVRVALGEVELEKWGQSACDEFSTVATVTHPKSLVELAKLTVESSVVVCNDSGPAHLAGILGLPTLALFGPTSDAAKWRPLGPAVKVIEASMLDAIDVDRVENEVNLLLLGAGESSAARSASAPVADE